ncbi:Oidioi.mRNA.OKI2018_I69.chr2.g4010.t1.cds [Oikopleura dioica]|uniref:Chloride channel protein n=1 Tax=Oikopleura dioica TaxID=34765 RepID=A0ABN7SWH0_OIKDI|nr:Oidioi.mRNA.OKI2018_I69.chr2.g4010.t1.cds [Oikopleura dioica]
MNEDDDVLLIDDDVAEPSSENTGIQAGDELYKIKNEFESLNYEIVQNRIRQDELRRHNKTSSTTKELERWLICFFIGALTGAIGVVITVSIEALSGLKQKWLNNLFHPREVESHVSSFVPVLVWCWLDTSFVLISGLMCAFLAPVAAGSGIPQIKCFLNGVRFPKVIRLKTLIVKVLGIILAVSGGLVCGKEGPMVHAGAVLAGGISQGNSLSLGITTSIFEHFRDDHEKRDFVAAGAAAGVSAAFGAPVGGVLFALEEAASFWNQPLTWRIFFCSMTSFMSLNYGLTAMKTDLQFGNFSAVGLLNFGKFDNSMWYYYELPLFVLMGVIGGLLGACFVQLNKVITINRIHLRPSRLAKTLETGCIALLSTCAYIVMLYVNPYCRDETEDGPAGSAISMKEFQHLRMNCGPHQYNTMSLLSFGTPETAVKAMFHEPYDFFHSTTLLIFLPIYWLLACLTYGISVPSGLFVPALLCGATWGRLVHILMATICGVEKISDPSVYALVGAAAGLAGTVRMTLSLCVIIIEATGNLTLALPITAVLITSKAVGDLFNKGIYDTHIHLWGVPILEWEPPPNSELIKATGIMSKPVVGFRSVETVRNLYNELASSNHQHNGFPVTDANNGDYQGLVLRSHILLILKNRLFYDPSRPQDLLSLTELRSAYPRYFSVSETGIEEVDMDKLVDLRPYINKSVHMLTVESTLESIFRLFRALGLRHAVVVDKALKPIGIVTRKDIARFRAENEAVHRIPIDEFRQSHVYYD